MLDNDSRANRVDLPVPVILGILVKWSKHYWQYSLNIVSNKVAEILIVPEIQGSFRDLEDREALTIQNCRKAQTWHRQLTWKCGLATDLAS